MGGHQLAHGIEPAIVALAQVGHGDHDIAPAYAQFAARRIDRAHRPTGLCQSVSLTRGRLAKPDNATSRCHCSRLHASSSPAGPCFPFDPPYLMNEKCDAVLNTTPVR